MDIKSFSDESFDPVSWINKSFDQVPVDSRDSHASGLVYKLQLFLQEINSSLEETALQVIRTLPFVLKQAEALEDEVQELRSSLNAIQSQMDSMPAAESAERLARLHTALVNMRSCLETAKGGGEEEELPTTQESDDQLANGTEDDR